MGPSAYNSIIDEINHLSQYAKDHADKVKSGTQTTFSWQFSHKTLRALIESSPDYVMLMDLDHVILFINRTVPDLSIDQVIGRRNIDFIPPDFQHVSQECFEKVKETGRGQFYETEYVSGDNETTYFHTTVSGIFDNGKLQAFISNSRDISELKNTQKELERERSWLATTQAIGKIGSWELIASDNSLFWTNETRKIFGLVFEEKITFGLFIGAVHPDDRDYVLAEWSSAIENNEPYDIEHRIVVDGQVKWIREIATFNFDDDGAFHSAFGSAQDITDLKMAMKEKLELEQKVFHSQKLESLGVLAGGIAHDFNNLLMGILGNAELGKMNMVPESPAMENLVAIETAAKRAAELSKQMLAYSGRVNFVVEKFRPEKLVTEMVHLLESSISKDITLQCEYSGESKYIEADATQIRQVIMNLIINASEAIGGSSGIISIRTGSVSCDSGYLSSCFLDEDLPEGVYVFVEIEDTGEGMTKEVVRQIFDPFFTTKFTGRGLGLAAVLGIVRAHHGAIRISSEPGNGSVFRILFPIMDDPGLNVDVREDNSLRESLVGKSVLLIDDEKEVREIGSRLLEHFGIEVTIAKNGKDGLEIFRGNPDQFDLVLLDLTMPEMDGQTTFNRLLEIKEDVRVVLSSGYSEVETDKRFPEKKPIGFVQKPYGMEELQEALIFALKTNIAKS